MLRFLPAAAALCALALPASAQDYRDQCYSPGWLDKDDATFAQDCVGMAFDGTPEDRALLAWLFFARANQLISHSNGMVLDGQQSGRVPVWMSWATDDDTFTDAPSFVFNNVPRDDLTPVVAKSDLQAGHLNNNDPDGANEEVTRNEVAYTYLTETAKLNTYDGVKTFFETNDMVNIPVGSFEVKASWLKVPESGPIAGQVPDNALVFNFDGGAYWWRGMHIMVKMQELDDPADVFFSEKPSWFWSTFEFNDNPGVDHVRETFITYPADLDPAEIENVLGEAGIAGFGFENYAPNGTQIRFTADGNGTDNVILGHTNMEDFAGWPNTAQAPYWENFNASCHACHATASYNPEADEYFPFSVPTGALSTNYNFTEGNGTMHIISLGYQPLDFMWPIAFRAAVPKKN